MFLAEVNIWNFRKYGVENIEVGTPPGISVKLKKGLNLLVGENDSGKTAIIDSIKYVLGTQSYDINRIEENDFYYDEEKEQRASELKIECIFRCLENKDAAKFIEWINLDKDNNIELRVRLIAKQKDGKIISRITAGIDGTDIQFEARDQLRTIYLKPLRDAEGELSSGYRSRFAQILKHHTIFLKESGEKHILENIVSDANKKIEAYFSNDENDNNIEKLNDGKVITESIDKLLKEFMGVDFSNNKYSSRVNIVGSELNKILSKLMLKIDENKVGLGTLNQLYMAMELLLLNTNSGLKLALIEEIEAHIHPQAQLRVIKHLQDLKDTQFIVTTHSVTLASIVKIENLILCNNKKVFPMAKGFTKLSNGDYDFLDRFLDATKSNLLFAKGVIMVEGDAENILLPTIAEIIDEPLEKYGVSIVNIGNTAFLRYSNIFKRNNEKEKTVGIPVSIVTDLDVRPLEYYNDEYNNKKDSITLYKFNNIEELVKESKNGYNKESIDEKYISKKDIEQKLKEILGFTKFPRGKKEEITEKYIIEINIDNPYYNDEYIKYMQNYKKSKYEEYDIKLFTNTWTMEYDIALSEIREYMLAAVEIAKTINNNESVIDDININEYVSRAKEIIKDDSKEMTDREIAYKIYKPLLNNNASKAVTAQYLADILSINRETVRDIIKKDPHIKYIVDAIYHAENNTLIKTEEV